MAPRNSFDIISTLSDFLLVLIISKLPFKDALKTSVLSKRWRNVFRETRILSFNEAQVVRSYPATYDQEMKRAEFVRYSLDWVSNFLGGVVETFELSFSNPVGFENEMTLLIEFAVSKKVKNLILDFSNPRWNYRDDIASEEESLFQIPECVYKLTNLVSLTLLACQFDPSKLEKAGSVKSLYFGWMRLATIMSLLSKTPLLESLHIKNCWGVGLEAITGYNNRLIKLVFKNCAFAVRLTTLDLPNILIFKYAGKLHLFEFRRVNRRLEEVNLNFRREREYHDGMGTILHDLLFHLRPAKTLTVCPFLLQVIQDGEDPIRLRAMMSTKRLVLKTNLEPHEFVGIRCMINSCPILETLTFQLVVITPVHRMAPQFNPQFYWGFNMSHRCLTHTLKYVEMWNFCGGPCEMLMLRYLIKLGLVLEKVDLYLPMGMGVNQLRQVHEAADVVGTDFEAGSAFLTISRHLEE